MAKYIMAFDQGTTSSRCILFTLDGKVASSSAREFPQLFPKEGWVEHDPMAIWSSQIGSAAQALMQIGGDWSEVCAIGITNQRETVVVWDKETGTPIYNAIVWQCRRTAAYCDELREAGHEDMIKNKTGLVLDPYFSASKIRWILDNVEGAREKAEAGKLCFGTVDTWLMYQLSGGTVFATDYTNASRTSLFNIHTLSWDKELLDLFEIPESMLPEVFPSAHLFGYSDRSILGARIPISGVAGDQMAALFGQCCFKEGMIKNTYGTGGFLLMNTGEKPYVAQNGLLTTIAWGVQGKVTYALEGSVFVCGAAVQWLRDGLKIIESASDCEYMASKVKDSGGVYLVPAFAGLGAPYWDPYARGMMIGLTRATNKYHLIRATLESMAYQTADVIELMERTTGVSSPVLRVDGGACQNNLLLSFQAGISDKQIERPVCVETTAQGAAWLAGLGAGIYQSIEEIEKNRTVDRTFMPDMAESERAEKISGWRNAVSRSLGWKA
ncbi:MAG: glycerol kinase GlpK [Clostridia bacterium]|nr:glycerol kinase GlpK [Clostridia bacterium]